MEQRQREVRKRSEIQAKCPDIKGGCGEYHEFLIKFSARIFSAMSSEFTFGENSDDFTIFRLFTYLADRDLTEYQIAQTLSLS